MSLNKTARLVVVAILVLTFGGCGKRKAAAPAQAKLVDKTVERDFELEVKGDREFNYKGKLPVRFVLRGGEGEAKAASIASITLPDMLKIDDGHLVNPEIAFVGGYDGDGKYTVPAGTGQAPPNGPSAAGASSGPSSTSVAQVTFIVLPAEEVRFGHTLKPCTLTLKKNATVGDAFCPALVAVNGQQVSLRMKWS